jgi:hypothetical protein
MNSFATVIFKPQRDAFKDRGDRYAPSGARPGLAAEPPFGC